MKRLSFALAALAFLGAPVIPATSHEESHHETGVKTPSADNRHCESGHGQKLHEHEHGEGHKHGDGHEHGESPHHGHGGDSSHDANHGQNREDGSKSHHGDGHRDHHGQQAIGEPGQGENATRTIAIAMLETDDGAMLFEPARIVVNEGETVRFAFVNRGKNIHEFVMDDKEALLHHKQEMLENPDMAHRDANAIRLDPGESGEIVWTFTASGDFEFACLIPGHYELGMHGALSVTGR